MNLRNWVIQSGKQWISGDTGLRDPLDILCELERRRDIIEMLGILVDTKLPNGKPLLTRRDIRLLYMYIKGSTHSEIEAKLKMGNNVSRDVQRIFHRIFKTIPVFQWYHLVLPSESNLEADVPSVKLGWSLASAMKAYKGSQFGTEYRKKAWKTKTFCAVPEYFEGCFGDSDTRCTLCSPQNCTRRKSQC